MQAYRMETVVQKDGALSLTNLPIQAGDNVEVIVLVRPPSSAPPLRYPLRGAPLTYIDPLRGLGGGSMIFLDTHIWVWWTQDENLIPEPCLSLLQRQESQGLGVSIISCWEVAKLVECQRLTLPHPVELGRKDAEKRRDLWR